MILVLILTSYYLSYRVKAVQLQYITGDNHLSQVLDDAIKNMLTHTLHDTGAQRFALLKANFPVVEQLKVRTVGLNKVHLQFVAADLRYRLGSNFVLSSDGQVFLANCFSNHTIHNLPVIFLHTNPESVADIEPEQVIFLLNLPDYINASYEVHWHGLNQINLVSKDNNNHQIVVRHDQFLSLDLLATCYKVQATYLEHTTKKCHGIIKIDLRFNEQIIMAC